MSQKNTDSNALIVKPLNPVFSHLGTPNGSINAYWFARGVGFPDSGMMQGNHFPTIIVYRRARRPSLRVGRIVEELRQHIDDPIFT